jgi:hypothetical protein
MTDTTIDSMRARAREYLAKNGTDASVSTIHARTTTAVEALERLVADVPAAVAARRPAPGAWSLHEIADHLVETHRPSLDELWCLLAGRRPSGVPIPAGLQSKDPLTRPWPWLAREMKHVHADILAAVRDAPPDLPTTVRAPVVMVFNADDGKGGTVALQWEDEIDWKAYVMFLRLHFVDHLNQARTTLAAVAGA